MSVRLRIMVGYPALQPNIFVIPHAQNDLAVFDFFIRLESQPAEGQIARGLKSFFVISTDEFSQIFLASNEIHPVAVEKLKDLSKIGDLEAQNPQRRRK